MCVYVGSIILLEAYGPVVMILSHMSRRTGLLFYFKLRFIQLRFGIEAFGCGGCWFSHFLYHMY